MDAKKKEKSGPYFPGQVPSDEAGHFFPDVLRVMDFKVRKNVFVRLMHCSFCGFQVHEIQMRQFTLGRGFAGMGFNDPDLLRYREMKKHELRVVFATPAKAPRRSPK
jgi:hypothetical protein